MQKSILKISQYCYEISLVTSVKANKCFAILFFSKLV